MCNVQYECARLRVQNCMEKTTIMFVNLLTVVGRHRRIRRTFYYTFNSVLFSARAKKKNVFIAPLHPFGRFSTLNLHEKQKAKKNGSSACRAR